MNKQKQNQFRLILSLVRIRSNISTSYNKFKKRIGVFLIFVFLATFFWFYRALDDVYVEDIKYPVKFENLPKNRILTTNPPKKISLRVRGNGYSILSKKFKAPALTFDVNNFSLHSQSLDSLSVYLVTRKAQESLSHQLINENEELEIISISPDTIFFNFAKTRQKKIPVELNLSAPEFLFAQQYTLNGKISISPDSVVIVGPGHIVDTITVAYSEPIELNNLKDSISNSTKLINLKGIKLSHEKINFFIPVDKFTESAFNLPLLIKHEPDSLILKVFPRTVRINYKVTLSQYNTITESDFRPYVDYHDIDTSKMRSGTTLRVYIDSIPANAFSTTIYPSIVEFLIESKNAEDRNNRRNR